MFERYADIISEEDVAAFRHRGRRLEDHRILMVNTAKEGGGVAQILNSLVPLLEDIGVDVDWRVINEDEAFFNVTKKLHNGLQGEHVSLSKEERERYLKANDAFWASLDEGYDFVLVHDPQPAALVRDASVPAVQRLHIDLSDPDDEAWSFMEPFTSSYDEIIVSRESYFHGGLDVDHRVVRPATDPFTDINKPLPESRVDELLGERIGSYDGLVSQVSRFDKWKDPTGVIDVFERVRSEKECSLFLLGSDAEDDPEGQEVYASVKERQAASPFAEDITVVMENNAELVNAAQRGSDVVVQKSIREGFGLTVSEAMLKGTPVVASDVGGIPDQVTHGETGFLYEPEDYDGFASTITKLLDDEEMKDIIGEKASAYVNDHYLMTRLLDDYLSLFEDYLLD